MSVLAIYGLTFVDEDVDTLKLRIDCLKTVIGLVLFALIKALSEFRQEKQLYWRSLLVSDNYVG